MAAMLATSHARKPAPALAVRALALRRLGRPDAFGSALGDSIVASIAQGDQRNGNQQQAYKPLTQDEIGQILEGTDVGQSGPPSMDRDRPFMHPGGLAEEQWQPGQAGGGRGFVNPPLAAPRARASSSEQALRITGLTLNGSGDLSVASSDGAFAAAMQPTTSRFDDSHMPEKLGLGGRWVANPNYKYYVVPPVAPEGVDSNFFGYSKALGSDALKVTAAWGMENRDTWYGKTAFGACTQVAKER
jgi:hypothetical protein